MAYLAITEGAPIIVYVVLPILLTFGICLIGAHIYIIKKTPYWVKRLEHRF